MKTYYYAAIACLLSSTALAQNETPPESVTVSAAREKFELPSPIYRIRSAEFNEVKGQYDLANGATLTMRTTGRRMYAEMDGMPKEELVAAAPNVFIAKNRQMKMTFEQADNGSVSKVQVKYMAPVESNGVKRNSR